MFFLKIRVEKLIDSCLVDVKRASSSGMFSNTSPSISYDNPAVTAFRQPSTPSDIARAEIQEVGHFLSSVFWIFSFFLLSFSSLFGSWGLLNL